jgi:hypothetical protein
MESLQHAAYGEQEGENSQIEQPLGSFGSLFGNSGSGSPVPAAGPGPSTSAATEESSSQSAVEVLSMLMNLKESSVDGELIFEKENTRIWYIQVGNAHRYTINKELSIDVNTYNSEVYFHVKRKNPKNKNIESVSIRAKLFPCFEFIYGHVAPKLQNQILGKNVNPKLLELAKNFARDH